MRDSTECPPVAHGVNVKRVTICRRDESLQYRVTLVRPPSRRPAQPFGYPMYVGVHRKNWKPHRVHHYAPSYLLRHTRKIHKVAECSIGTHLCKWREATHSCVAS